jgi:3-hydroxybutyrate dehydrogenase
MALSVAGKTAIVTGAGSGINYCFARLLLQKQCNVIFADLALRPEAKDLVSQYSSKSVFDCPRAVFQKTDVTNWSQLDQTFRIAREEFNGADIVCPGAGIFEPVRFITILTKIRLH